MCLVKVRTEEDITPPSRIIAHRRDLSPVRRTSRRVSRVSYHEHSASRLSHSGRHSGSIVHAPRPQSASYVSAPAFEPVPAPSYKQIPAPQPVPVFVAPPPMPVPAAPPSEHHYHHHHPPAAHYVEVSPRSSISSSDREPSHADYMVHEREREIRRERSRARDYSPERGDRYEHFRYVEAEPERGRYEDLDRDRGGYETHVRYSRSRSRGPPPGTYGYEGSDQGGYRERERVVVVDGEGRRRREYRR